MEKTIPIKNQMNGIFVHVTDLKRSAQWYSDLVGLSIDLDR